ncbi:hypothetical protein OZ10_12740 [Xanthomonas cannabis pv. cannabis]|nr:hypothetical protein OZ10_12740 [Xanthomonas cannabis pv. cannabis]
MDDLMAFSTARLDRAASSKGALRVALALPTTAIRPAGGISTNARMQCRLVDAQDHCIAIRVVAAAVSVWTREDTRPARHRASLVSMSCDVQR